MLGWIKMVRDAAIIKRSHTERFLRIQTVGEHTFNVLNILIAIVGIDKITANLLLAAQFHDMPETRTGDMPANFKWAAPEVERHLSAAEQDFRDEYGLHINLGREERELLKFADRMEYLLTTMEERLAGNRHAVGSFERVCKAIVTRGFPNDRCQRFYMDALARFDKEMGHG